MIRLMPFPATLFDFNGVLVDDEYVHFEAFRDAVLPLGITLTEAEYWRELLGFDDAGGFRAILSKAGRPADEARIAELVEAKRPRYLERAKRGLKTFEGARRLVESAKSAGPVGIVSGALRDEIRFGLDVLGVAASVDFIVSAEDAPRCKPDPQGYELAVRELTRRIGDQLAQRALVIEDSLSGIEAAKRAGLACLAVAHSYPETELETAGADRVVARLRDIDAPLLAALYDELNG